MSGPRPWQAGLAELRARLGAAAEPFVVAMARGTMRIELFAPRGRDVQQPHDQDELYIVNRGEGWFVRAADRVPVKAGDVLFVPAGAVHRFEEFSEDFETWVIFWGPKGGEADPI